MLIAEKIQEINDKHAEILAKFDSLEQKVNNTYEKSYTKALKDLKTELESSISTSADTKLAETNEALKLQNTQELNALKSEVKSDIEALKQEIKESSKDLSTQATNSFLESFKNEAITPLSEALKPSIDAQITQAVEQNQAELTKEAVKAQIDSVDLSDLVDYERIKVDSSAIAKALKSDNALKNELIAELDKQAKDYIESSNAQVLIKDEIKKNATTCFKSAMAEDELIKMRYECALRLQSFNILGTQELISRIQVAIRKPQDKITTIRNNTLVSQ